MAKDEPALMTAGELKPLLMRSKSEPVNCAIGMTKDKTGVILLDKKMKPKKLFADIKKQAADKKMELDMGSVRYGTASVDTEVDAALVQFKVNKDAPGTLRPKMLELLKKAGFQKCEIIVDSAIDAEEEAPVEQSAEAMVAPKAGAESTAEAPATTASAPAEGEQVTAQAETPPAAQADTGPITQRLTGLVKQMMGVMASNPPGVDAMKTAAMAAQTAVKSSDVETATKEADTLERLLAAASAAPAAGPAATPGKGAAMGSPVFDKASATWTATRKKVEGELDKLSNEMQSVYKDHGVVDELEKAFRDKVEPMMAQFDNTLSGKLTEVSKNADPGSHAKLVGEAQQLITKYESFLANDPLIAKLDKNPFVDLAIGKTLTASLAALSKAIN